MFISSCELHNDCIFERFQCTSTVLPFYIERHVEGLKPTLVYSMCIQYRSLNSISLRTVEYRNKFWYERSKLSPYDKKECISWYTVNSVWKMLMHICYKIITKSSQHGIRVEGVPNAVKILCSLDGLYFSLGIC